LCDQLAEGGFGRNGQIRLRTIGSEMLGELHSRYNAQTGKPPKAAANVSPESGPKPVNGAPPSPSSPLPPSNSIDLGPRLLDAYRLIDTAGIWLEKLAAELEEVFGKIGGSSAFSFLQGTEGPDLDNYSSGDGWVVDGWRWTFPTRHRKHRIGNLSVVADIGRPGRPAAAIGEPCMLVMWSSAAHDWADSVDAAKGFWPPPQGTTGLLDGQLFHWTGKVAGNGPPGILSLKEAAWFYLVRMAAVTNIGNLRTHVMQPALALLGGTPVEAAFAKAPDVLRFRQHGKEFVLDT
jgi:hypothetical protein